MILIACVVLQKDMIPVHYAALTDKEEIVELFFNIKPDTMTQINSVSFFFHFQTGDTLCYRSNLAATKATIAGSPEY